MTDSEINEKIERLISGALESNDDELAAAERLFLKSIGLTPDDAADFALAELVDVVGGWTATTRKWRIGSR